MKKALLILSIVSVSVFSAKAQAPDGFQFGAGLRVGLPVGDFSNISSFGIGGEVQGEYGFNSKFSAVFNSGYTSFLGKKINVLGIPVKLDATGYIPVLAGVRYYPSAKFFFGAQAGVGILTGDGSETAFNWQPQFGVNTEHFQIALNYNGLTQDESTLGHIGLTGIVKFGGSKKEKK